MTLAQTRTGSGEDAICIFLCVRTGNPALPWARAGYDCYCVDMVHQIRKPKVIQVGAGRIIKLWGDVRSWFPPTRERIAFVGAHPPCTDAACSGARDFKKKGGWLLADAIQLFDSCRMFCEVSRAPYYVENPKGRFNSHRVEPDHIVHPWEYAGYLPDIQTDNTTKETCLWTGGGFVLPEKRPAPEPHRHDCWMASPGDDRANLRAVIPMGFAEAVFLANCPLRQSQAA